MHQAISRYHVDARDSAAEQQLRRGLDLVQEAFDNKVLHMTDEVNHWKQTCNAQRQQITLLQNESEELKLKLDEMTKSSTSVIAERRALMVSRNALLEKYNTLRKWALQLESFKKTIFQMFQEGPQAPMSISDLEKTYFSEFEGGLSSHLSEDIAPATVVEAQREEPEPEPDSMFLAEYMVPQEEYEPQYENEGAYHESAPQLSSFLGHDSDIAEYEPSSQIHQSENEEPVDYHSLHHSNHDLIHVSSSQPEHSSFMPDLSAQPENPYRASALEGAYVSNSTPRHIEENIARSPKENADSFLGNFSLHSDSNSRVEPSKLNSSTGHNPIIYDQDDSSSESGIAITADMRDQTSDIDEPENYGVGNGMLDLRNSREIPTMEHSRQSNHSHYSSEQEPVNDRADSSQHNDDMDKSIENSYQRSTPSQPRRSNFSDQVKLENSYEDGLNHSTLNRSHQSNASLHQSKSPTHVSKLDLSTSSRHSQQRSSPKTPNMNISRSSSSSQASPKAQSPKLDPKSNHLTDFANTSNVSRASHSSQRSNGHQVTPVRAPTKAGSPDSAKYSDVSVASILSTSSGRKMSRKELYGEIKRTLDQQEFSEFAKTIDDFHGQRISLPQAEQRMQELIHDQSLLRPILKMLRKKKVDA
ncbi:hypothetical protein K7432_000257 [Basidiobolus ranarum]|uniref:Uncharacterized protein n=1 Tax=Basidiobolus ranarum TaxID=34480 RepID=A0ABR2X4Z2_9FUNG